MDARPQPSDRDGGDGKYVTNCDTLEEAIQAMHDAHTGGNATWIVDQETRKQVDVTHLSKAPGL